MLQITSAECTENTSVVVFTVLVYNLYPQRLWFAACGRSQLSVKHWATTLEIKCLHLNVGKVSAKSIHFQNETFAWCKLKFTKEI